MTATHNLNNMSLMVFITQNSAKHRAGLSKVLPNHGHHVRNLSQAQVVLLLTMYDVESMRSAAGRPASIMQYFVNSSINQQNDLSACMQVMADRVRNRKMWGPCHLLTIGLDNGRCRIGAKRTGEGPSSAGAFIAGPPEAACWQHTPCREGSGCRFPVPQ